MTRSKRLLPIHKITEHEERQSAQRLTKVHQTLMAEKSRLAELVAYRQSYLEEFKSLQKIDIGIEKLTHMQQFIARLNETIQAQQNIIQRCASELERQRQHWRERHLRTEALSQAIGRFRVHEQEAEDKQSQKILDEIGARMTHSRRR